jgi:CPA2 family monovalent cation:H+ antiporter-2
VNVPILKDIVIILGLSAGVVFAFQRLKIPAMVGFLLTGLLAGPHGLALVKSSHEIEILAEAGVALLLFTIGMEFSFKSLLEIKRIVLWGGSLQIALSALIAFLAFGQLGRGQASSIFLGLAVALSSTAIVLKLLQEKAEMAAPHGRISFGILIFQDLMVVPILLLAPLLAGRLQLSGEDGLVMAVKWAAAVAIILAGAKWLIPRILDLAAGARNRELFIVTVVLICFAMAWLTSSVGLSLALGAFIAGLIISESPYSHQAIANVLPLRDIFTSLFFVSIGMLMDLRLVIEQPLLIILVTLAILILKTLTGAAVALSLGFPLSTAILTGMSLSQVGEFSFLLCSVGVGLGLVGADDYQIFIVVSVLTMASTPFLMNAGRALSPSIPPLSLGSLASWLAPAKLLAQGSQKIGADLKNHIIIVGYGLNGRNVARAAKLAGIPYVVVEMNPATVRAERAKGEPIIYGDASYEAVLDHLGIKQALVLVVTIADPVAIRRIVATARHYNPKLYLIVRTRFTQEMELLLRLGANEVIPEEYETAVEIFARVLRRFLVPKEEIDRLVAQVRSEGYGMLRRLTQPDQASQLQSLLQDVDIATFRVQAGSPVDGQTVADLELRKRHGLTLLALRREGQIISNPGAQTRLMGGDLVVIMAHPDKMASGVQLFLGRPEEDDR